MSTLQATRRVLIVGGGLAGPCLALCLARHSIPSTVFEIRPSKGDGGGSISLGPDALRILDKHIGAYRELGKIGYSYYRMTAYSDLGEKFGDILVGEEDKRGNGYPSVRIMRSELHRLLLEATGRTRFVDFKYGVKISEIKENDTGVEAIFDDGSSAKGDILIGADGVHSKVRDLLLKDQSPKPIFDKLCITYGFLPSSAAKTPSEDFKFPAFMFTPSGLFMTIPIDREAKTLAWVINKPIAHDKSREEWRELEKSGEAARLAKSDYDEISTEPVRSLLDKASDEEAKIWPTYSIPDIPIWHSSRVCLIGDAAHALPPNGQGTALAFEDAALLARMLSLKEDLSYEKLFFRFEEIRRPRIAKFRETKIGGAFKSKTGPIVWYLKKWGFRAFFWWNNGILQFHKGEGYDVDKVHLGPGFGNHEE